MKCPHCLTFFHSIDHSHLLGDGPWSVVWRTCPACDRIIIHIESGYATTARVVGSKHATIGSILCYPRVSARFTISRDIPKSYTDDYAEACATLGDSPRASAALSRRCMQAILRECAQVTPGTLSSEIRQISASKKLPAHLNEYLEAVEIIGNFAAHPEKSASCATLCDVEPGEGEWNLDVLEALFDYYFVQPELINRKRGALIARLNATSKQA